MNIQYNNTIVIIFVIYILSFYQINCDNNTSGVNNSSATTLKPTAIIESENVEHQISKPVKKDEHKLEEVLHNVTFKADEPDDSNKSSIKKRPGVIPLDVNISKTLPTNETGGTVALTTQKPIIINNTIVTEGESPKTNGSVVEANTTKVTITKSTTTLPISIITTTKSKKPEKTIPSEELPEIPVKPSVPVLTQSSSNTTIKNDTIVSSTTPSNTSNATLSTTTPTLIVDELDSPKVQFSQEEIPTIKSKRDYIIPVVALIFAIPIVLAIATILYRRAKDFWETRHYRRMDFLIDEMYND